MNPATFVRRGFLFSKHGYSQPIEPAKAMRANVSSNWRVFFHKAMQADIEQFNEDRQLLWFKGGYTDPHGVGRRKVHDKEKEDRSMRKDAYDWMMEHGGSGR